MTKKILTIEQVIEITAKLKHEGKRIVLAGGCFDIFHVGHLTYLEKARKEGDVLIVFLESDKHIKETKGHMRPINTQQDRARILAHLDIVDYVITLPDEPDYDGLVIKIKPAIIATTEGDLSRSHKERQAKKIGAKVIDVTTQISNQSTSKIITIFNEL